jgi:membrane-associated protease RseP (regulator of RpoE activity)
MAVFVVTFALAIPSFGQEVDDEKASQTRSPHQELRDAVSRIRSHYIPGGHVSVGRDLAELSRRPRLGIILQGSSIEPSKGSAPGAVVLAISPGSPADEAGLQPGDVITGWNGQPLGDGASGVDEKADRASRDLVNRSKTLEDGESVTLQYLRDGVEHEATLVAREIDFSPWTVQGFVKPFSVESRGDWPLVAPAYRSWSLLNHWSDMELVALNPELGAYFGSDTGVLVVRGPSDDESLGLESGDVILRIGDREVKSPEHAMRILRSYEPEENLTIDIIRHQQSQTLTGTIPQASRDSFPKDYLRHSGD